MYQRKKLLLIEDHEAEARLIKEAFHDINSKIETVIIDNGQDALAYIQNKDNNPDLIILDLNIPLLDGFEFLKKFKTENCKRKIPVIVLSNSHNEHDILKSYELYANCFILKPLVMEDLKKIVSSIDRFWFNTVALPR